ncbi:hypothetical protein [Arthrobacter sp. MA-N2]|uniref:hypothetical protein n=1 Tax=Arthrobacter sp. MA-N2 TaxID=1101188 RepID=UPI0004880D46|nr:hypothetical protein [Arthrobacter sp. MA-N2]
MSLTIALSRTSEIRETIPATSADPYAGIARHVWQSLFILISMMRPGWNMDEIADAIFTYRSKLSFQDLSAVAIRVAQDSRNKTTLALRIAVREAADR